MGLYSSPCGMTSDDLMNRILKEDELNEND